MDFAQGLALSSQVFLLAVFLATVNERLVEFFFKPALSAAGLGSATPYVALLLGALISVGFGIDLFTPIVEGMGFTLAVDWAGLALSALAVGGGSNLLHDVWPES